jgi:hypothetical protein
MSKTIVIYGDSHANTFLRGNALIQENIKDAVFKVRTVSVGKIQDDFVLKTIDDDIIINPALTVCMQKDRLYPNTNYEGVLKKDPNLKLFLLFGTGLPHRLLVNGNSIRRRYFEYFTADEPKQSHQVVPILKDMLKEELQHWQRHLFHGLDLLKEQGYNNIGILGSPPLHRDYNFLLNKIVAFKALAEEKGLEDQFCFGSDHFRTCLYQLSEEVIKEKLQELGYQYISSPQSTKDEMGFLKPQYNFDGVHGNAAYALEFATHIVQEAYNE